MAIPATTLTAYNTETGLYGGDFWVTVAKEYDCRSGPVRDAVEATMSGWMRRMAGWRPVSWLYARILPPTDCRRSAF